MANLLRNTLYINLTPAEQNDQKGCLPLIECRIQGPIPSGSVLAIKISKEDRTPLLEYTFDTNEASEEEYVDIRPYVPSANNIITEAGIYFFQCSIVSELEGVDEMIYEGKMRIKTHDGGRWGKQFALDTDWALPAMQLWLDVYGDSDAPVLFAACWLKGDIDTYETGAYLFYNGKKLMSSENRGQADISNLRTRNSDVEGHRYKYFTIDFHLTKAYLNCEYGNMDGWHILSQNPGNYEIKITASKKLVRVASFTIAEDGKIVIADQTLIEPNGSGNYIIPLTAKVNEGVENAFDISTYPQELHFGGKSQDISYTVNDIYEHFAGLPSQSTDNSPQLDAEVESALSNIVGKITNNYNWYYKDLKAGGGNLESAQIEYLMYSLQPEIPQLTSIADKIPDGYLIEFGNEKVSVHTIKAYLEEMVSMATSIVNKGQDDAQAAFNEKMTPYEAVLTNDKLRICQDRPPHDYLYYTSNKKVIETPEQLQNANAWYFEGGYQEGGDLLQVSMWTVKGFKFDEAGNLIEEYQNSGVGRNAPSSAFP